MADEPETGRGPESEAALYRERGLPLSKRVIEILALGEDPAEIQRALLVATPEQREAANRPDRPRKETRPARRGARDGTDGSAARG
jgi:hypothetical protein